MSSHTPPAGDERLIYERALPAVPHAVGWMRRELDAVLQDLGVGRSRRHDVSLVLSEAAANVVVHAYTGAPGLLYALAMLTGDDLRLDVFDSGQGMVPRSTSPGLGVGLALMARLSDGLEIAANGSGGMQVSALFHGVEGRPVPALRPEAQELADYIDALRATVTEIGDDHRALVAEAQQAVTRARELRTQRRRGPLA